MGTGMAVRYLLYVIVGPDKCAGLAQQTIAGASTWQLQVLLTGLGMERDFSGLESSADGPGDGNLNCVPACAYMVCLTLQLAQLAVGAPYMVCRCLL